MLVVVIRVGGGRFVGMVPQQSHTATATYRLQVINELLPVLRVILQVASVNPDRRVLHPKVTHPGSVGRS